MIPKAEQRHTEELVAGLEKFWRHVVGGGQDLLQIWTGVRGGDGAIDRATIKFNNFSYPKAAEAAAQWALEKSEEGREVYFCCHLLKHPRRVKENAAAIHCLWGDLDGAQVPNGDLKPTAVVESSPGRYHVYYRLSGPISPEAAERLNKGLAEGAGADPSGFDLTQLLRVPFTPNRKYEGRPTVRLRSLDPTRSYSPARLASLLSAGEGEEAGHESAAGDEPPVALGPDALRVWRGERPKLKENGETNRSETLLKIGRVLFDAGGNRAVVVEGVRDRDRALGFNKYSGNRDGGQREYLRIWEKLVESGRNNHGRPLAGGNDSVFQDLADLPNPEEFPISALPITLRQFVREAAASVGCPVDYTGLSALAAVSAAIGDTRRIVIKRDWTEGAAIFGMIVGGPASKKTTAMNLALKPVRERQMALKTEYKRQQEEYKSAYANYRNALKDDPDAREPEKPTLGRIYADDTTVERLADVLHENRRGLLIIKDELSGWLGSMNQYKQGGKGADRQFWLSAHTNQPVVVDRKSLEEPVILARPFVSIIGGIQPEVLPDFGKDRGDGLIDRFIPVYPKPRVGRWTDDEISDHVHEEYKATLGRLYKLRHANEDEDPFPSRVGMTSEAKALFVAEYNRLHDELEAPGFPQRLRPAWGKLEAYFARFALIIAMARLAELGDSDDSNDSDFREYREKIIREDMVGAAQLLAYFKNHARRVYTGLYGDSPSDKLAADLRDLLISVGGAWEGTATDLDDDLVSDHKPDRPEDLSKAVRAICKRTPALTLEELQRTNKGRPFRLTLEIAGTADTADIDAMQGLGEARGGK
jgi:hypothetical protein